VSSTDVLFSVFLILSLFAFRTPVSTLVRYSLRTVNPYDKYSYTIAIPFISLALGFLEKRKILATVQSSFRSGAILLFVGLVLNWCARSAPLKLAQADNALSIKILALVICWLAGFILCYGAKAFRAGAFLLLFLFLTVPIPDSWFEVPITAVQHGSANVAFWIFKLVDVPVVRNGLIFSLSNVTIEVARECSGIHSTVAIVIISLIAGHLLLPSVWKKGLIFLIALPVVCVTNGLRIAGLTLLAEYVNPLVLQGPLHRHGGVGFFLLGIVLLGGIVHLLRSAGHSEPL
jgi:exosortase